MANINYVGFPANELKKIKSIIFESERIVRHCEYGMSSWDSRTRSYYTKWFGKVTNNDKGQVPNVLSKMLNCLTSGKFKLIYNQASDCSDGKTYAAALAGDRPETYHDISKGTDFEMTICAKMWELNRYKETENEADTQVLTFIHELSHMAGGTDDEPHPTGTGKAYGKMAATALAQSNSNSARNNADNYAFFCKDMAHYALMSVA